MIAGETSAEGNGEEGRGEWVNSTDQGTKRRGDTTRM